MTKCALQAAGVKRVGGRCECSEAVRLVPEDDKSRSRTPQTLTNRDRAPLRTTKPPRVAAAPRPAGWEVGLPPPPPPPAAAPALMRSVSAWLQDSWTVPRRDAVPQRQLRWRDACVQGWCERGWVGCPKLAQSRAGRCRGTPFEPGVTQARCSVSEAGLSLLYCWAPARGGATAPCLIMASGTPTSLQAAS